MVNPPSAPPVTALPKSPLIKPGAAPPTTPAVLNTSGNLAALPAFTKNGSNIKQAIHFPANGSNIAEGKGVNCVLDLAVSDYIEVYAYYQDNGGGTGSITGSSDFDTYFTGFKLIG